MLVFVVHEWSVYRLSLVCEGSVYMPLLVVCKGSVCMLVFVVHEWSVYRLSLVCEGSVYMLLLAVCEGLVCMLVFVVHEWSVYKSPYVVYESWCSSYCCCDGLVYR